MTVPPTALQFYFDLFGLGDPEKHAYNEVLVSYLPVSYTHLRAHET